MGALGTAKANWRLLVVIVTPVVLGSWLLGDPAPSLSSRCAFVLLTTSVYWLTEALPLPVTGLMPLSLLPLVGVMSSKVACKMVFNDTSFLVLGGIIISIAIEESNLHKRFALRILLAIGVRPRRLMLGVMVTTAFLSMWISNTATTAMMMPITRALLAKLFQSQKALEHIKGDQTETPMFSETRHLDSHDEAVVLTSMTTFKPEGMQQAETHTPTDYKEYDVNVEIEDNHNGTANNIYNGYVSKDKEDEPDIPDDVRAVATPLDLQDKVMSGVKTPLDDGDIDMSDLCPDALKTLKTFSLCVCYSANVGGLATLTGTPTNLVLANLAAELSGQSPVTFANWFAFGLPVAVVTLVLTYGWMNVCAFGLWSTITCRAQGSTEEVDRLRGLVEEEYRKLGRMRFQEKVVLVHFLLLVTLWLTRDPGSFVGWAALFPHKYTSDGATAMALAVSLFIFPREWPNVLMFRRKGDTSAPKSFPSIVTWQVVSRKFPWGVIFLLAGGTVLATASKTSGLSAEIALNLQALDTLPTWAICVLVCLMTSMATELTSNMAVCSLLLPILADLAHNLGVHPLYFLLPTTIASSLAFMLPVATPPNALVHGYGDVQVSDMMKSGLVLNLIGVAVVTLAVNTWGWSLYALDTFPSWPGLGGQNTTGMVDMLAQNTTGGAYPGGGISHGVGMNFTGNLYSHFSNQSLF